MYFPNIKKTMEKVDKLDRDANYDKAKASTFYLISLYIINSCIALYFFFELLSIRKDIPSNSFLSSELNSVLIQFGIILVFAVLILIYLFRLKKKLDIGIPGSKTVPNIFFGLACLGTFRSLRPLIEDPDFLSIISIVLSVFICFLWFQLANCLKNLE